jgi:hypothetical protein
MGHINAETQKHKYVFMALDGGQAGLAANPARLWPFVDAGS